MDRVDIEGKIRIVLQEKFDVPSERLKIENYGEPLTGSIFEFTGVKLLYLFFEIEKSFKSKRLIFRYDRKIPDYFSVVGAP